MPSQRGGALRRVAQPKLCRITQAFLHRDPCVTHDVDGPHGHVQQQGACHLGRPAVEHPTVQHGHHAPEAQSDEQQRTVRLVLGPLEGRQ